MSRKSYANVDVVLTLPLTSKDHVLQIHNFEASMDNFALIIEDINDSVKFGSLILKTLHQNITVQVC